MRWPYWVLAGLLPMVPDFDAFSTASYGSPWGHRGVTHSLVFALWLGALAASLTFRYLRTDFWFLTAVFFAAIASHGLLDALTRGGEKIPFFWPSAVRLGNWGPMPVPDIAMDLPNPWRSRAVRAELLWVWLPTALVVGAVMGYRWSRSARRAAFTSPPPSAHPSR
jgi:inner membrane protein